jgi:hypothetical protein
MPKKIAPAAESIAYRLAAIAMMGLCLAAVIGFFFVTLGTQQLDSGSSICPVLAAWLPLLV